MSLYLMPFYQYPSIICPYTLLSHVLIPFYHMPLCPSITCPYTPMSIPLCLYPYVSLEYPPGYIASLVMPLISASNINLTLTMLIALFPGYVAALTISSISTFALLVTTVYVFSGDCKSRGQAQQQAQQAQVPQRVYGSGRSPRGYPPRY